MADQDAFRRVRFQVRYTKAPAWICLPGAARLTGARPVDAAAFVLQRGMAAGTAEPLSQPGPGRSLSRLSRAARSSAGCRVGAYQVGETVYGSGREGLNQ